MLSSLRTSLCRPRATAFRSLSSTTTCTQAQASSASSSTATAAAAAAAAAAVDPNALSEKMHTFLSDMSKGSASSEVSALAQSTYSANPSFSARRKNQVGPMSIPPAEDPLLAYFVGSITKDGHRAKASRTISRMMLYIRAMTKSPALPVLREAVFRLAPAVKVTYQRRGAKNIARPQVLSEKQRVRLAVQWMLKKVEKGTEHTLEERLAREVVTIIQGTSSTLKSQEELHTLAMVNRGNITLPK